MIRWLTAKRHKKLFVGDRVSKVSVFWGVLSKSSGGLGRVQRKVGRLDGDRISLRDSHFLHIKWIYSSNSMSLIEVPGSLLKIWKMKKSKTMWSALRILPKVIADQLFCTRNAKCGWEPGLWIHFSWGLQTHNLLPWHVHEANDCPSLFSTRIPVKATICPAFYGVNAESVHYETITTDVRKVSSSSSYLCFNSLKCFSFI